MATDSRDEAIREAKRYVRDIVQNDWSFEFSAKPGAPPPTYPPNPDPTEVLEWRLREYDSTGSEFSPPLSPISSPASSSSVSSVGTLRTQRRRKRRRQMEDEMSWNEGLRTWVERRDAWSGALSKEQVRTWEQRQQSVPTSDAELQDTTTATSLTQDTDAQSIPASTTSHPFPIPVTGDSSNLVSRTEAALNLAETDHIAPTSALATPDEPQNMLPPPSEQNHTTDAIPEITDLPQLLSTSSAIPITSPSATSASASTTTSTPTSSTPDPLIPVVPSLIATTNPIRASITPAMYPSIYSKVVIQGLTPTVPINLADMTKAMVQGWKADGQWPPKPQNLVLQSDAFVRPSNASVTKHPDTPAIPPATGLGVGAGDSRSGDSRDARNPPSSPESKRKSGIASTVRKVLHFSGFHPHPFHRRGSSSQHNSHPEDLAGSPGEGTENGNGEQAR
ncbi:hypothetical protein BJX70DRAFT_188652 [Aspergillus crustosus]